jgi:hypothetical protein
MCPACLMTAAWAVVGTSSAGGVAAFVARNVWGRKIKNIPHGVATHGPSVATTKERDRANDPCLQMNGSGTVSLI